MSEPGPYLEPPPQSEPEATTVAAFYDDYWNETDRPRIPTPPVAVARLMKAEIAPGSSCLDVGCGNGRAGGLPLRALGCHYVGVDVSAAAVEAARQIGLDARQIDDAIALPFPDATFDAVLAMELLEHVMFPLPTAVEILRVLKPNGLVLVTTPNVAYWRRRLDLVAGRWNPFGYPDAVARPWADPHIRFFTTGALYRLLDSAGYASIKVGGHSGAFLADIPGIGARFRKPEASVVFRALERKSPSLFGCFLNAVARKPGSFAPTGLEPLVG